jgi:hypothetical protein
MEMHREVPSQAINLLAVEWETFIVRIFGIVTPLRSTPPHTLAKKIARTSMRVSDTSQMYLLF